MAKKKGAIQPDLFTLKVEDFPLDTRTINILLAAGFKTAEDFRNVTLAQISSLEGLGAKRVLEVRTVLKGAGIAFKREIKEKKVPKWPKETKEILIKILGPRMNNYAENFRLCGMMINEFGVDCMRRFEVHPNVDSLRYYFSGGQIAPWASEYAQQFMVWDLAEEREEVVDKRPVIQYTEEELNYKPIVSAPKTLADFLKSRNGKV